MFARIFPVVSGLVLLAGVDAAWAVKPMIAADSCETVALKSDSTVYVWGCVSSSFPQSNGLNGVTAIDCGIALKGDGTVWTWEPATQVSGLSGIIAVARSGISGDTVVLKGDGTVWSRPYKDAPFVQVVGLSGVSAIVAGSFHKVALKGDGTIWAWGDNETGQLGDGTTEDRITPVLVSGLSKVTAVATNDHHTVALKSDGTIWTWGSNYFCQLGDGTVVNRHSPAQVKGFSGASAIAAGAYHTLVLKGDGTVWAWGLGRWGQLGNKINPYDCRRGAGTPTPVQVKGLFGVTAIAAGTAHSVVLKQDGTVWAWGYNYYGQLGYSTEEGADDRHTPVQVLGPNGVGFLNLGTDDGESTMPVFETKPDRLEAVTPVTPTGRSNAVVITHGYKADAADWVDDMAGAICEQLDAGESDLSIGENQLTLICSSKEWDVYVQDWREQATPKEQEGGDVFDRGPWQAYLNAITVGEQLASQLSQAGYSHIHFIAHSAGSNLIHFAAMRLKMQAKRDGVLAPTIHQTFLDAYDPRDKGSAYGLYADWADNYVDTRTLFSEGDYTRLFLANAYNIDVTPDPEADVAGCGADFVCKHGRPYRFYGKSISVDFLKDSDYNKQDYDPVNVPTGIGYPLSVEEGKSLKSLQKARPKGSTCRAGDTVCYPGRELPPTAWDYLPEELTNTTVAAVEGTVDYVLDRVGTFLYPQLKLMVPVAAASAPYRIAQTAATNPTTSPAWIVTDVTTTGPTNTLRFSYQFAATGEGLLRVFVNEDTVREMDQRYLPLMSTEPENIYVGELPAGTHRIAFRLDGYGQNDSGITLAGVQLGQEVLVEKRQALTVKKAGTGSGTVRSNPAGITCGTTCTASFNSGTTVTLAAGATVGSVFTGWTGACTGKSTCTVTMDAAKTVTATFTRYIVRINDVSQMEGNPLTFTVALHPASTRTITVKYATVNGTALAGSDYTAKNGLLTFTPGKTTQTITVLSTQDTLVEADETFTVKLTAPNGAAIADNVGLGIIRNDDR